MVQKAATMGVPIIAMSAPTALAVRTADAAGITLVAIARADGFEVFAHDWRIAEPALRENQQPLERVKPALDFPPKRLMRRRPNRDCNEASSLARSHPQQNLSLAAPARLFERITNLSGRVDRLASNIENDISCRQTSCRSFSVGIDLGDNDPFIAGALDRAGWSETEAEATGLLAIRGRGWRLERRAR
jgi:hypothetical protein